MRTLELFSAVLLVSMLLATMLVACGGEREMPGSPATSDEDRSATREPTVESPTGARPADASTSTGGPARRDGTAGRVEATRTPAAPGARREPESITLASVPTAALAPASAGGTGHGSRSEPYRPASLSAGEVDDNEQWEDYLEYLAKYHGPAVHEVDVSERYMITVRDGDGRPLPNTLVRVASGGATLFEGLTYANGQTLFFPRALPEAGNVESFQVSAERNGVRQAGEFSRGKDADWPLVLDTAATPEDGVPLDVLFLLDSTGSMADEIDRIKDTLLSISARISDLPSQPDLRFGMVSYRDRGDLYITRVFDFDSDPAQFSDTIRNVRADGGGDEPESLNEALHTALNAPDWRRADAVRLVFLLADAPPHLDYQDDFDYAVEMVEARKRGIKIFSVASSGLNDQGEYIFRQIAQNTMGRFIFLLYEGYGGGLGTPHDVDEYTVERLDDLVVRLITEELAVLSPG